MTKYDARKIVEAAIAEGMMAQDAFIQNIERLAQQGTDLDATIEHRNARTRIAIYTELKGIRAALTEIAQMLGDRNEKPHEN